MKLLCIGSFNQDIVYKVEHIAAAGETIAAQSRDIYWGGKGLNQAIALARSFSQVYMAGMVNEQESEIHTFLRENNVHDEYVFYSEQPTGHAVIYVDQSGQNSITVFGGANQALTEKMIEEILSHFSEGDLVLIQNETNQLETILHGAHARKMKVALNPSPFHSSLLELSLELVDYFLINEIEGFQLTGEREPKAIVEVALKRFPNAQIVLTLGDKGALYANKEQLLYHGTYDVSVVDTTAAGDTFTGYFLSGIARGLTVAQALEQASKASSIAVSRKGATSSIPTLEEVLAFEGHESELDI